MYTKKRLIHMDIAKGIGILAIILGHTNEIFVKFVFPFHVPLFFFISGYFLSRKKDSGLYIKEKAQQLLIPYGLTCLVLMGEHTLLAVLRGRDWKKAIMNSFLSALYGSGSSANKTLFSIEPIGAIWFLLALFWSFLLIVILLTIVRFMLPIILFLAVISVISCHYFYLPWSVQSGMTASVYVYLGLKLRDRIRFNSFSIAMTGLVTLALEIFFNISLSIAQNHFDAYGITAIGALLIIYLVIWISKMLVNVKMIGELLSYLGRNTLPLLCFHLIEITMYPWGHFNMYIDIILLIGFPVICITILRKTKVFRIIFG